MESKVIIFGHYRECCAGLKKRVEQGIKDLLELGERYFCVDMQNEFAQLVLDVITEYMVNHPDIQVNLFCINDKNKKTLFDECDMALCYVETGRRDAMCQNLLDLISAGKRVQNLFCVGDGFVYPTF